MMSHTELAEVTSRQISICMAETGKTRENTTIVMVNPKRMYLLYSALFSVLRKTNIKTNPSYVTVY